MAASTPGRAAASDPGRRRSVVACAMIGAGLMAAVDEIVFHQLLAWHHFYDGSTRDVALLSDGLLHAGEIVLLVAGFFTFADVRRRGSLHPRMAWAGGLLGAGGFQLFDGLVNHKLLNLHQVRYGVHLLPYDLAWNVGALLLLVLGAVLARGGRSHAAATEQDGG